jgi:hypothetical protein
MVLRTVAMVLGIIGGVYGLMMGLIGGGITAALLYSSNNASVILIYSGIALLLGLAPPIIGVVGAAIVRNRPLLGSSLMGVSSILMGALGFMFPLGFVLAPPVVFFLVGAILGVIGKFQS